MVELGRQMGYYGFELTAFASLEELQAALAVRRAMSVMVDYRSLKDGDHAGAIMQDYLGIAGARIPVLFFAEEGDINARLRGVRMGADAFFVLPLDISDVMETIFNLTGNDYPAPYRVLIVDDSQVEAHLYAASLRHMGIDTEIVTNPFLMLMALTDFNPDLVLLDVYMPGCSGLDLARLIRQMERFVGIPIVFLSAETNKDRQLEAMGMGGDDFLVKPIQQQHLFASVRSRVERYRKLRSLMMNDGLTALLNHTTSKLRLSQEVARASRQKHPVSLAMIDLDNFKRVNDTYRHSTGDRVLKNLANFLRRRLRRSDIIGRYGGEEFSIIFPDTSGPAAAAVMHELCTGFAHIPHHVDEDIEITVTFSCGVASFPHYSSPSLLSEAADQAMYEAKRRGRNCVILAPGD